MLKYDVRINYKERVCESFYTIHHIITDCTSVEPIAKMLMNEGYEIESIEERNINWYTWKALDDEWKETKIYDTFLYSPVSNYVSEAICE